MTPLEQLRMIEQAPPRSALAKGLFAAGSGGGGGGGGGGGRGGGTRAARAQQTRKSRELCKKGVKMMSQEEESVCLSSRLLVAWQ
jgi:hypothetical protein